MTKQRNNQYESFFGYLIMAFSTLLIGCAVLVLFMRTNSPDSVIANMSYEIPFITGIVAMPLGIRLLGSK